MRVLLTGFEPFGGRRENASAFLVDAVARRGVPGIELETAILPVVWARAGLEMVELIRRVRPDAIIALGESSHEGFLRIETHAANVAGPNLRDNEGRTHPGPLIVDGESPSLPTTLDHRRLAAAIESAGVPTRIEDGIGAYLCNLVAFVALHAAPGAGAGRAGVGFLHAPMLESLRLGTAPSIGQWEDALVAAIASLER